MSSWALALASNLSCDHHWPVSTTGIAPPKLMRRYKFSTDEHHVRAVLADGLFTRFQSAGDGQQVNLVHKDCK